MRAAFYSGSKQFVVGDVPVLVPAKDEVRVKVAYCGICGTDMHIYHGKMDERVGIPQIIGHEMSGTIDAVGANVNGFSPGDKVVVRPLSYTTTEAEWGRDGAHIRPSLKFLGIDTPGAFQTHWTVPAHTLHKLPANTPLDLAALCEPLAVACHDVRLAAIKDDNYAVVLGGGPIGILIALVARHAGARVLVSEINPVRISFLQSLGFTVLNPLEKDLEQTVSSQTRGVGADVVFEVTATHSAAEIMTKLPCVRGTIVVVGINPQPVELNLFPFFWKELRLIGARVYEPQDYVAAIDLLSNDTIPLRSLISRIVALENINDAFTEISSGAQIVKTLIQCS